MTKYFDQFPIIKYNLSGVNGNTVDITDIFRRVKARSKLAGNITLFDKFDVDQSGTIDLVELRKMIAFFSKDNEATPTVIETKHLMNLIDFQKKKSLVLGF